MNRFPEKSDFLPTVLHVVSVPGIGGAQIYVEKIVKHLSRTGFRAGVICNDEPALVACYSSAADVIPIKIPYRFSLLDDLRLFWGIYCVCRSGQFDIVQTSAAKASFYGRLAAKLAGVPLVIFTAHGFVFHDFMHPVLRWALMSMEWFMSRFCTDMVVSVSEADRRYAVERGVVPEDKILTIRNGIDLDVPGPDRSSARRSLGLDAAAPVLGFVGRLSRQKAPWDFLKAAALVAEEFPKAQLLLVGDGPLRGESERLASELGICGKVRFLGFRDDVATVMAALDIFVLSSLWEGLPFTVLEAMRAAIPVVATSVNGVPEVVLDGKTGWIVPPERHDLLASGILALLRDPATARSMGERGRLRVEQDFSLERMNSELSALYLRLHLEKKGSNARGRSPLRARQ